MQETYADSCCEGHRRARTQNGRRTFEEAPGQYDDRTLRGTFSGFRTLDIRTDRLLSSWLREVGVPDGALKANEPAPDFLLPEAN